ncbi:hypothetical protein [Curtobacterium sp. ZW137]|uniref:hypothetical protein n=1 Tax=Curtobacterium sp. ZW137 TaxID=2485104 RepID=UPI000F4C0266|nr:hypothetical protein [Curtobacterium sp. ZW137]ROP65987.1 hypothetical protein EDF55_0432 [Curtobacterium sp. ZW137]
MRSPAFDVELIRTSTLFGAERRAAERAAQRGQLLRVRSGVLVRPRALDGLRPADRHLLLVRASLPRVTQGSVVGWLSASSVHGLPSFGAWPAKVHLLDPTTAMTTVTAWFVRHGVARHPFGTPTEVCGIPVTDLVRTVVDVAATRPLLNALPAVDHVLRDRVIDRSVLIAAVDTVGPKAHARARTAVEMGSALSGSPAESICRVRFRQVGAPEPVQQHEFARPGDRRAVVDFWFPDQGVVVEVDGRAKYEDTAMLAGASTADAHWREKQREDFVRSFDGVRGFVRLTWADLMDPEVVRAKLARAGIPCR